MCSEHPRLLCRILIFSVNIELPEEETVGQRACGCFHGLFTYCQTKLPTSFRYPLPALDITIVLYFCQFIELPKVCHKQITYFNVKNLGYSRNYIFSRMFACVLHFLFYGFYSCPPLHLLGKSRQRSTVVESMPWRQEGPVHTLHLSEECRMWAAAGT